MWRRTPWAHTERLAAAAPRAQTCVMPWQLLVAHGHGPGRHPLSPQMKSIVRPWQSWGSLPPLAKGTW